MRASRILSARPERTIVALAQLCEERESEFVRPLAPQPFVPPRLAPIPAQTPYSVGSNTLRPKSAAQDRLSPPPRIFESSDSPTASQSPTEGVVVPRERDPPEHMAPKRSKWTSPPPADDPDHTSYENRLGLGISLATSSSTAREPEPSYGSSSSNSEILTDEDIHDRADLESVGSFTSADGQQPQPGPRRPLSFFGPSEDEPGWLVMSTPKATNEPLLPRGRTPLRFGFGESGVIPSPSLKLYPRQSTDTGASSHGNGSPRRSSSGPPAPSGRWPATPTFTPLPPSPPNRRTDAGAALVDGVISGADTPNAAAFSINTTIPTSVRTPFPLYQQLSPSVMTSPLSIPTPPPSNAFTAQHPVGATDVQPSSSSSRRSSWQRTSGSGQTGNGTPNPRHSPTLSPMSNRRASKQPVTVTMPMTHTSPTPRRNTSPPSPSIQRLDHDSPLAAASSPVHSDPAQPSPTRSNSIKETSSPPLDTTVEDSPHISMKRLELTDSGLR